MSEPKWTADQKAAIETNGRGIVVSAAAGSGKTAVLIERIIRLLTAENGVPADKLLAVTFTNDAAAQMRDKLNKAFEKKLAEDPDNGWLLKQQNLLQLARISTINSFCLDLVKDNLHKFDFQGGLKILDEAESDLVFEQAFQKSKDEFCKNRREDFELLDNAFEVESDTFMGICESLYDFLRSLPFRKKWIENACSNYTDTQKVEQAFDDCFNETCEGIQKIERNIDKLRYYYNYSIELGGKKYCFCDYFSTLSDAEQKGTIKPGWISSANDTVSELNNLCRNKNWDGLGHFKIPDFRRAAAGKKKDLPNDVVSMFEDCKKICSSIRDDIKEITEDITEVYRVPENRVRANLKQAEKLFRILCDLAEAVEQNTYEIKLEKNAVDFADVELMAKDLLVEETSEGYKRTELAEDIRKSHIYEIIMIDEFQDVNNLQELIFRTISDSDDPSIMGKNIFVVGDVKQAIYRFRLTNPKLFKRTLEVAGREENREKLQPIYLKKNFRSRKEVIDFVNFVFSQLMSVECGDVEYNENERLELGASYSSRRVPTEVMLINQTDGYEKTEGYSEENLVVAQRIKSLLDEKEPVFDNGSDRPCRPSDVCVLVQTNSEKRAMGRALEAVGLKAQCKDENGYLESREISIMIDILRIIDNPMNDISMTAVMMSPIMNFSADDMAKVREKSIDKKTGFRNHIFQVLTGADVSKKNADSKEADYIDFQDDVLQKKCTEAYRLVDTLRYYSMSMNLERLIRKIFDMTDLIGITTLYRDSLKKRANLRLLLEYASQYENNTREGVSGFLRYIDSVSDNQKAFQQAITQTEHSSAVSIQTYHASKGLEYPFVFLCQLWSKIGEKKQKINLHNDFGCAFQYSDNSKLLSKYNLIDRKLERICNAEDKSEKMRLLYVGCTRAKEKLFISYSFQLSKKMKAENAKAKRRNIISSLMNCEGIPEYIAAEQESMLDWITLALSKYPENNDFMKWMGIENGSFVSEENEKADMEFKEYSPEELEKKVSDKQQTGEYSSAVIQRLNDRCSFKYQSDESKLPSKLTVTEIVREEKENSLKDKNPEFYPNLPRLEDELDKLSSAEKGTFTHKFMELANYENAERNVEDELNRLVKEGFFTPHEAKGVYTDKLTSFFSGDFYKRMKQSSDLRREQRFLVAMRDLKLPEELQNVTGKDGMIQGIADCIFKEKDGWVLVDYKTDNFKSEDDMKKYGTQLQLYKAAFELIFNEKIKSSYIYSFKLGVGIEFEL